MAGNVLAVRFEQGSISRDKTPLDLGRFVVAHAEMMGQRGEGQTTRRSNVDTHLR